MATTKKSGRVAPKKPAKRKARANQQPATMVLEIGYEGGGVRVGYDPSSRFWFRASHMSASAFGEEGDLLAPVAADWERNLTWSQVLERLRKVRWWCMYPVLVDDDHVRRVRSAIENDRLSSGWVGWLADHEVAREAIDEDSVIEETTGPVEPRETSFDRLGKGRVEEMRSFLTGLVGLWEPFVPADIDAILALIPKEHWTLAHAAADDPSSRVRELARVIDAAQKRGR